MTHSGADVPDEARATGGSRGAIGHALDSDSIRAALSRDHELGGDPACWLNQVCDACGRMIEDRLAEVCPHCGTPRDEP